MTVSSRSVSLVEILFPVSSSQLSVCSQAQQVQDRFSLSQSEAVLLSPHLEGACDPSPHPGHWTFPASPGHCHPETWDLPCCPLSSPLHSPSYPLPVSR